MLNVNTICCFCCRWCGWMRYCFCLPKLRKWNKGGNSGSARRRGGGGAWRCPQPAFRPLFLDQPVSRTSVIFFLKTVFFPNQWRIHGGAPVIFCPNCGPQKNCIWDPPPPPPYLKVWIRHCAAIPLRRFWRIPLPEWRSNPGSREYPSRPW